MIKFKMQKNKKGSIIAYTLVMIIIVSLLLTSAMQFVVSQMKYGYSDESKQEAFEIAEAGMSFYRWYLAHKTDGKNAKQIAIFWAAADTFGVGIPYEDDYKDPWTGVVIGRYKVTVVPPDPGSTIADATIEGWTYKYPNNKRKLKIRFRRASWSEYMILSNVDMGLGSGRIINGKFHTNGGLRFDGVKITGEATSSKFYGYTDSDYSDWAFGIHIHNSHNDEFGTAVSADEAPPIVATIPPTEPIKTKNTIFKKGRGYAKEKVFAEVKTNMTLMKTDAAVLYDRAGEIAASSLGRHITLKADGHFTICRVKTAVKNTFDAAGESYPIPNYAPPVTYTSFWKNLNKVGTKAFTEDQCVDKDIPNDGIIYIENDVWIDGTLDGLATTKRVTVVANNPDNPITTSKKANIYLGKANLTYAHVVAGKSEGKEILGLVAQNNIEIIKSSPNNLTINAALLAMDGKVFYDYQCNTWKTGTITIMGAIATNQRYMFSSGISIACGSGVEATGYANATFEFDKYLMDTPPPYFPTGSTYLVDMWEEI